jgi:hypothetical protein
MAHFAELDENYIVLRVIVVDNINLLDVNGEEQEPLGIEYIHSILGNESTWVQTSYNNSFRGTFAGIGYSYDPVNNEFIPPLE